MPRFVLDDVFYVRKIRSRMTVIVAWSSPTFMVGFWSWYLFLDGADVLQRMVSSSGALGWRWHAAGSCAAGGLWRHAGGAPPAQPAVKAAKPEGDPPRNPPSRPPMRRVTLHVAGMVKRLNISETSDRTGQRGPVRASRVESGAEIQVSGHRSFAGPLRRGQADPARDAVGSGKQQGFTRTLVSNDPSPP